ncbi:hypothetical protein DRI50_09520 [candidate division KSB1 bacterium]|jgi:hypothetical protein|nr:MAG: hypothetical protein DRI50_09520 [candidate division KSB1 bacterium]
MNLNFNPSNRDISLLFVLGLFWGVLEAFAGKWIKGWQPNLFGFIMPFVTAVFIIWAKRLLPLTGSILMMGIMAAVIKLFCSGMILHGAFMAILFEAVLAEFIFIIAGTGFWASAGVGMIVQLYSMFHPLLTKGTLCQSSHVVRFKQWLSMYVYSGHNLQKSQTILILLILHLFLGFLAAAVLWPVKANRR